MILLAFQACDTPIADYYSMYGTPAGFARAEEILLRGYVLYIEAGNIDDLENADFLPVKGIAVCVQGVTAALTNANGEFSFFVPKQADGYDILFIVIDGTVIDGTDIDGRPYETKSEYFDLKDVENSSKTPLRIWFE